MHAYAATRPGTQPWYPRIPTAWSVERLKVSLARNDAGVWGEDPVDENGTVVLRSTDQTASGEWKITDPARRSLSQREVAEGSLAVGDLVVTKSSGSAAHIGKATIVTPEVAALGCCFSNFMQRLRCGPRVEPRFVYYLLNSAVCREQLALSSSTTTGLANLNGTILGNVVVPVPPLPEQRVIVAFLDRETVRIDELTAKKEQLIALLRERVVSMTTHAIARGLGHAGRLKDSGVPAIGAIPAPWTASRLMHLTQPRRPIMYGIVLPGPDVEGGVPIVKGGDVSPLGLRLSTLKRTTAEIEAGYVRSRLAGGDLVYAIRGSIGAVEEVPDELLGANITQDVARVSVRSGVHGPWLMYALRSAAVFAQLDAGATGATIRGINIRDLKRVLVPVPSMPEQMAIASYLRDEIGKIDALVNAQRGMVSLLEEERSALITAAVTGQIDVRGEVPA